FHAIEQSLNTEHPNHSTPAKNYQELRNIACQTIKNSPILQKRIEKGKTVEKYLEEMSQTGTYATDIEIAALSYALDLPILVISTTPKSNKYAAEFFLHKKNGKTD